MLYYRDCQFTSEGEKCFELLLRFFFLASVFPSANIRKTETKTKDLYFNGVAKCSNSRRQMTGVLVSVCNMALSFKKEKRALKAGLC